MSTAVALIAMTTERRRAAARDGIEHFDLRPAQAVPVPVQKAAAASLNDICHLPGWPCHYSPFSPSL